MTTIVVDICVIVCVRVSCALVLVGRQICVQVVVVIRLVVVGFVRVCVGFMIFGRMIAKRMICDKKVVLG